MSVLEHDSKSIMDDILSLKSNFGDAASIYDTLLGIQQDAEEMKTKVAETKDILQKLQDGIKQLSKGNIGIAEKTNKINDMNKISANMDSDIIGIKDTLSSDLGKFESSGTQKRPQKSGKGKPSNK